MGDKYTSKGKILHKRDFKSGYGNELLRKKLEVFSYSDYIMHYDLSQINLIRMVLILHISNKLVLY